MTVPPDVLAQGDVVCIRQGAAGQVTLSPGSGVTFASSDDLLSTRTQSAQIAVIADSNQFGVIGERNAPSLGVALLDQANVFTRVQGVTPYRANISGAVSIDLSATARSNNLHLTLTGNVSSFALTNPTDGAVYNIRFIQDGTGSRTFAGFPAAFKFAGGTAPTFSTAAGAVDFLSAEYGSTGSLLHGRVQQGHGLMFTIGPALGWRSKRPVCCQRSLLLHFAGADGSTTFTDQVAGRTWAAVDGVQIGTAESKFGGAAYKGAIGGRLDQPGRPGAEWLLSGDLRR